MDSILIYFNLTITKHIHYCKLKYIIHIKINQHSLFIDDINR